MGFTPFVEQRVIGTVCRAYKDIFPRALVIPQSGDTDDLVERLKAQELDAALVTLPLGADGAVVEPVLHESLVVCLRRDDPLAGQAALGTGDLNGRLGIFSDPRHHPRAHERLLEMLAEHGIKTRIANPTFNAEHVQWMVRERLCVALIREHEPLHEELTTHPIRGVSWTVDSASSIRLKATRRRCPCSFMSCKSAYQYRARL